MKHVHNCTANLDCHNIKYSSYKNCEVLNLPSICCYVRTGVEGDDVRVNWLLFAMTVEDRTWLSL